MPRYELVVDGVPSAGCLPDRPGCTWATEGTRTVLRAASQDDLVRALRTLEGLGLGLTSLRQL